MVEGFVYVSHDENDPMSEAEPGVRVRTPSWDPPWIVVNHDLDRVIVGRWPGRLFRVRSVPPSSEAERAALARAAQGLRADAHYTRGFAVDVMAELAPALLFGRHGDSVVEVLERARSLTEPIAAKLAAARAADADQAYGRAWQSWLDLQPGGALYRDGDHSRLLAVPGAGPVGSPIGDGFIVLDRLVTDSAKRSAGPAVFTVDEDGEETLREPWATARLALLDAAMALGATHPVDPADAALLASAWRATVADAGM